MSRLSDSSDPTQEFQLGLGADKAAFVHRLQTILAHWPSADRLARAMGVSPSAFRKWLKGEAEPSRERLVALARATGVGVAWLAEGEGPAPTFEGVTGPRRRPRGGESPDELDWNQFVVLPDQATTPANAPAGPIMRRFIALRQDWVRAVCGVDPENLQLQLAPDESMAPTIRAKDTMLVDTSEREVGASGVDVLESNGTRFIRRVQRRHDGALVLISDNTVYQPDVVAPSATVHLSVIGRVVWVGGTI